MATFEVPDDVLQEFEDSLDEDIEKWSSALAERFTEYESEVEKKNSGGVMIGYFLPEELAEKLVIDGGEDQDELHLTLFYFGDAENYSEREIENLKSIVAQCARIYAPLQGEIGGVARFPAGASSDNMDVLLRLVDVPRLEGFRERLLTKLEASQLPPRKDHGYTAHVTLAYVGQDWEGDNEHPEPLPLVIDNLVLAVGGERFVYPLNGEEVLKVNPTANAVHINKPLGGIDCEFAIDEEECEEETKKSIDLAGTISKIDEDKRLVFGWASVISKGSEVVTDLQGDRISEEELEKMAYGFVRDCRDMGVMHESKGLGQLVESVVLTKAKQQSLGIDLGQVGWWCGFHVTDSEVWKKVKDGTYSSFSIHGKGFREPVKEDK